MSKFKFSESLFLEKEELNTLKGFLQDEGFEFHLKNNTVNYGLVKNPVDPTFNNFRVTEGTASGGNPTINIGTGQLVGLDINNNIRVGLFAGVNNLPLPDNLNWFWVAVSPIYRPIELGVVSIDSSGNLIGNGSCKFTSILRGQPNFATRIKLYQNNYSGVSLPNQVNAIPSTLNPLEYDVLEIIDDNNAILSGDIFISETNLVYAIVGTFSPGYLTPDSDKYPFQYDDCLIQLLQETNPNTPPSLTANPQFFIARVQINAGILLIQDKRINIFQTKADFNIEVLDTSPNPLIGIEKTTYDNNFSSKENNIIELSWVYRSTNYNLDLKNNKITILSGGGGKWKPENNNSDHVLNNMLAGWRVYLNDHPAYFKVLNSSKSGSSIILQLDTLIADNFLYNDYNPTFVYGLYQKTNYNGITYESLLNGNKGNQPDTSGVWRVYQQQILITPDVEQIELEFSPGSIYNSVPPATLIPTEPTGTVSTTIGSNLITSQVTKRFLFNINEPLARIALLAFDVQCLYNLRFRYKNHKVYSFWQTLPADNNFSNINSGYFPETFNYSQSIGVLNPKVLYTSDYYKGYVLLNQNTDSFYNFKQRVDTGNKFGIRVRPFLDSDPQITNLFVGVDEENQLFTLTNVVSQPPIYTFPQGRMLQLRLDTTGAFTLKSGNHFKIKIQRSLNLAGNSFVIYQGSTTNFADVTTNPQNILFTFTQAFLDANSSNISGIDMDFFYDVGTAKWYLI